MKKSVILMSLACASGLAHADLIAAKGTKATVTVEYLYAAVGSRKDKFDPREWRVSRTVSMTAQFVADKPQALAQMRAAEAGQVADMQSKQATAKTAAKKMTPMMGDMMAIVQKCGENQACIEKAVEAYGNSMEMTPELKSAGADIQKLGENGGPRYQMWKAVSQTGKYSVDEYYKAATADPLCVDKPKQRCNREETRTGGGDVPTAPGKGNLSGAMFEIDAQKKDVVMVLPVPMMPMPYSRDVKSDFPGEVAGAVPGQLPPKFGMTKPITVVIPGDLRNFTGSQQVKAEGTEGEGGTLTVKWTIVVQ